MGCNTNCQLFTLMFPSTLAQIDSFWEGVNIYIAPSSNLHLLYMSSSELIFCYFP